MKVNRTGRVSTQSSSKVQSKSDGFVLVFFLVCLYVFSMSKKKRLPHICFGSK